MSSRTRTTTTNETKTRRRAARSGIVVTNNDTTQHTSSEEDDDVISIHSSSSFEDFDTMWEKHVAREQSRETAGVALLATQPTLMTTAPTWTETTTGITTVDTTTTATNHHHQDSANRNTSKLAKMSFSTMKQRDAHPPPRVSLSPRNLLSPNNNAPTRKLGNNNVTTMMLEAVVTGASHDGDNVFTNRVDAVMKQERKNNNKKQSRNDGNDAELATDANRDFVSSSFANHSNELESTTSNNGKKDLSVSKTKSLDTNKKRNKSDEESKRDSSHKRQQQNKAASSSSQTSKSLDANKKKQKKDSATNVSTDTSVHSNDANKHGRNKTASTESTLLLVVAQNHPSQQQQQVKDKKQVKPSLESKEKVKTDSSKLTMTSKSNDKAATTTAGTKRKSGSSSSASATKPAPPLLKKPKRTFQDEILLKMLLSCKPYTLKTLAHAVGGSTEAAIHHVMLSLVDKGIVIKKEFSSTKSAGGGRTKDLYWANQTSSAKQVQALELPSREEMIAVKEEYASYRAKHSLYSRELQLVEQEPSNEQLNKQLLEMERAVSMAHTTLQETKDRIAASKQDTTSCGIQQNPLILKKRINHMRDEWKDRKTKCRDFVDQLADGLEKPIKAVVKLLELETDEMEGVTVPPKYDIGKK